MPMICRCPNLGNCDKADARELITMPDGVDLRCPECAVELVPVFREDTTRYVKKIAMGVVAILLVFGIGWFVWRSSTASERQYKALVRQSWDNDRIMDPSEQMALDKLASSRGISRMQARQWLLEETGAAWAEVAEGQYKWMMRDSWENDRVISTSERTELDTLAQALELSEEQVEALERAVTGGACPLARAVVKIKLPNTVQLSAVDVHNMLPMMRVPAGTTEVPAYLKDWLREVNSVTSQRPFDIMTREVTIGEFRRYVATLDEQQLKQLGDAWQGDNPGESFPDQWPVSSVPWWAAKGYADWLSSITGCALMLPTANTWMAAVVKYARPEWEVISRASRYTEPTQRPGQPDQVFDLLGNLREWSADACKQGNDTGHYWLGEDYHTARDEISGKPDCRLHTQRIVGFRLMRQDS